MLIVIGSLLLLVGAVFALIILIAAFKEGAAQGLLCMFVPFYVLYYAFARYRSPNKGLIVGGWLSAIAIGFTLQMAGLVLVAGDAAASVEESKPEDPNVENDIPKAPAKDVGFKSGGVHCNSPDVNLCEELSVIGAASPLSRGNCKSFGGTWGSGPCPTKNKLGYCDTSTGVGSRMHYYKDELTTVDDAKSICEKGRGVWTAASP